jgi:hypothetical protein
MLLFTGKSLPNVLDVLMQLGSQAKEVFFTLEPVIPLAIIVCRRPDCLAGDTALPGCPISSLTGGIPFPFKNLELFAVAWPVARSPPRARWTHRHVRSPRRARVGFAPAAWASLKASHGPSELGRGLAGHCGRGLLGSPSEEYPFSISIGFNSNEIQIQTEFSSNSLVFGLNFRIRSSCM